MIASLVEAFDQVPFLPRYARVPEVGLPLRPGDVSVFLLIYLNFSTWISELPQRQGQCGQSVAMVTALFEDSYQCGKVQHIKLRLI